MTKKIFALIVSFVFFQVSIIEAQYKIINGDERLTEYLPMLKGKKVGLLANHTALVNGKHLLDILIKEKVQVTKLFSPEHGFRGNEDAGNDIKNQVDKKTKLNIISLYGDKKKPSSKDLEDVDILLFDIQDVGVRFFTYISTLTYAMEACAENGKQIIILDRPNPNANYVDGPVLNEKYKSFVGMHQVPIVYGMTIGEYAQMVNGERWLSNNVTCNLVVIGNLKYNRKNRVELPINPSPNLNSLASILYYPSLCFFEGTVVSVGRGTKTPFTIYGHPNFMEGDFYFTPKSLKNMSTNPPFKNTKCRGFKLAQGIDSTFFTLRFLQNAYRIYPEKDQFFNNFFNKLAGNAELKQQIIDGLSEEEIRKSWMNDIEGFKLIRKKYLIYEE